ncbi:MAG TPA: cache domain-containing protein [Nitrospirota bacterium]|nr:cache domain-containing protein [Nitrospirota bacterium]
MFQRLIRTLKQRELITPTAFILAFIVVLSLIILLGQFFHQSLQEEMAEQFNKQQLLLARQVAANIDDFILHVFKDIRVISRLPEIERINRSTQTRNVAEAINFNIQNEVLVTIRVLSKQGIVLYDSSYPGREGVDLSKTDYFKKASLLPRNERLITDLLSSSDNGQDSKQFIVATPIYQRFAGSTTREFNGIVLAVLSMDGLTQKFLAPIKSGTGGYAWMMDSTGTLLYHPTQPQMVGKNLYQTDKTCFQCHKSFDTEKKMIEGKAETSGYYEAPSGEDKLAAFYKIPMATKSWVIIVSAPYSDVIALMQKSMRFYSLLILSIFITTLVASGTTIITYKKKIQAEEISKHFENQRRLERQIEISKDFLENIIENTKTNLMVIDKDLMVRTVNTAQARTLGRPKKDIIGKPLFSLFPDNLPPYEGIPIKAIFQKTLTGRSFEIRDYRITGIQDLPLYLTMNMSPLLIDGRTPGILITSNDVTKRVELEEALKQYTVELEDKVDKGTATAKKLEQQVLHSEKLAALGRLAAGVAHEIGNPLTSISTFAQLLREMATDEFSQNSLDVINNHIQRITEIVRRMSTFSRADSLNIKYIQINEILTSTLDLMRLDKRMKSTIEIGGALDPDLPKTMIDEGQISQVFINIILNALDAMSDGGKLTVTTKHGKDDQGRDAIMIAFADTGIGISKAELEKIFDPFYTTKEVGKGTGLGLSVSYNIVKRFKGDIKVESEPGKGTVFTIILPVENG